MVCVCPLNCWRLSSLDFSTCHDSLNCLLDLFLHVIHHDSWGTGLGVVQPHPPRLQMSRRSMVTVIIATRVLLSSQKVSSRQKHTRLCVASQPRPSYRNRGVKLFTMNESVLVPRWWFELLLDVVSASLWWMERPSILAFRQFRSPVLSLRFSFSGAAELLQWLRQWHRLITAAPPARRQPLQLTAHHDSCDLNYWRPLPFYERAEWSLGPILLARPISIFSSWRLRCGRPRGTSESALEKIRI